MSAPKAAQNLRPRDIVVLVNPAALALVVDVKQSETMIGRHGSGEKAPAAIVIFDVKTGPMKGQRHSDFVHPLDRVRMA